MLGQYLQILAHFNRKIWNIKLFKYIKNADFKPNIAKVTYFTVQFQTDLRDSGGEDTQHEDEDEEEEEELRLVGEDVADKTDDAKLQRLSTAEKEAARVEEVGQVIHLHQGGSSFTY